MHHVSLTMTVTVTGLEHGTGMAPSAEPRSAAKIGRRHIVMLWVERKVARKVASKVASKCEEPLL